MEQEEPRQLLLLLSSILSALGTRRVSVVLSLSLVLCPSFCRSSHLFPQREVAVLRPL